MCAWRAFSTSSRTSSGAHRPSRSSRRRPAPKRRRSSTRSLHAPFEEGGDDSLAEKLGEEETGYRDVEDGSVVATGLDALDERERRIVELRFFEEMTQSQIAAEIGISQMHVSRLLRRALVKMRGRIEEVAASED